MNIERVIPMHRQRHASMHHARLIRQIAVAERRPALDIRSLDAWASHGDVHVVVIDSAGEKVFCAGGDIAELYQKGRADDYDYGRLER